MIEFLHQFKPHYRNPTIDMSNFWFNDGNMTGAEGQSSLPKDDAFLSNIFDLVPAQNNVLEQAGANGGSQAINQSNNAGDINSGVNQASSNLSDQSFNPQMLMRADVQGQGQNLDKSKQEQLLRMRQQVMQQQMLKQQQQQQQRQQQQQHQQQQHQQQQQQQQQKHQNFTLNDAAGSPQPRSEAPTPSQSGFSNNMRASSQGYAASPVNMASPAATSGQGQFSQGTPNSQFTPMMQNNRPPNTNDQQPGAGGPLGKFSQQQLTQLQYEIFIMTLNDFMARRGTPLTHQPVVNNKKVNLLFLHLLSQKLGGPQQLTRVISNLQQQPNPFSAICQKLNLFEGINIQLDVNSRMRIEKETASVYVQYILPYEQFAQTTNGARELQTKRLHFQKQILMKLQQQQIPQQSAQQPPVQTQSPAQPQIGQSPVVRQNMSPPIGVHSPAVNSIPTPVGGTQQSPVLSLAPTPQQRKLSHASNPSNYDSPGLVQSPYIQQQTISRSGSVVNQVPGGMAAQGHKQVPQQQQQVLQQMQKQRQALAHTPQTQPAVQPKAKTPKLSKSSPQIPTEPEKDSEPNIIKNYIPLRKLVETHDGYDIKSLSSLAGEIEMTKPVYLFAPELGSINLPSLIMALKNYTTPNSGEIFSALNTLLVTTSDSNYSFKLSDAPELLDSLSSLGLKILEQIVDEEARNIEPYDDVSKLKSKGEIDDVFNKYVSGTTDMKGEDVAFVVDSLSAELIEDEDSDMDLDEIFSLKEVDSATPMVVSEEEEKPLKHFGIPDNLTTLLKFKEENKYHFSKLQVKSAVNEQVMLVDELITITMILRNVSFSEDSKQLMARNPVFKDLLFRCVKYIAAYPDKFVFFRERLCILKDCLLMLDNIALIMELRSLEEAFLAYILISSFGPKLGKSETTSKFSIPYANLEIHSCLPFGIDAFTKLLVREPVNRTLMQAVLSGTLSLSSTTSNFPTLAPITITAKDQTETRKLMVAYFNGDESEIENGGLMTRSFQLLMSIIPFDSNSYEYSKFSFIRAPTITQALFGVKLLIDMIPFEENVPHNALSTEWLLDNKEIILLNFSRISLSLVTESSKYNRNSNENKILSLVILKSLIVVNSLIGNAVILYESPLESPLKPQLEDLNSLYRIAPDENFALESFLLPAIDPDVSQEVVRLLGLLKRFV